MKKIFLETNRIILRYMTKNDFGDLKMMLQNPKVMYAWEKAFNENEIHQWLDKNLKMYEKYDLGYFIIEDKNTGEITGQAALMPDSINNKKYYEIGYILKEEHWHKGYAAEAARVLAEYAFKDLKLEEIIFEIRPNNTKSRKVAEKMGAKICGTFTKTVFEKEMEHLIYALKADELR